MGQISQLLGPVVAFGGAIGSRPPCCEERRPVGVSLGQPKLVKRRFSAFFRGQLGNFPRGFFRIFNLQTTTTGTGMGFKSMGLLKLFITNRQEEHSELSRSFSVLSLDTYSPLIEIEELSVLAGEKNPLKQGRILQRWNYMNNNGWNVFWYILPTSYVILDPLIVSIYISVAEVMEKRVHLLRVLVKLEGDVEKLSAEFWGHEDPKDVSYQKVKECRWVMKQTDKD